VPVARIHAVCEDESIIGSPFYVMDMVEGRVFWDAALADLPKGARAAYYDETNRVIAALHNVDYGAVGLGDYGAPGIISPARSNVGASNIWPMIWPDATR
jgi:aminoglycoside phosphotransferase (APT) family kinase protein